VLAPVAYSTYKSGHGSPRRTSQRSGWGRIGPKFTSQRYSLRLAFPSRGLARVSGPSSSPNDWTNRWIGCSMTVSAGRQWTLERAQTGLSRVKDIMDTLTSGVDRTFEFTLTGAVKKVVGMCELLCVKCCPQPTVSEAKLGHHGRKNDWGAS
jgi:hypothetical protein